MGAGRSAARAAASGISAVLLTGAAVLGASGAAQARDPVGAAQENHPKTKQGRDYAVYSNVDHTFKVCDKEKDGHPVYAYFSGESGHYYYDYTGAGGKCQKFKKTKSGKNGSALGTMYVCEEVRGWDPCSSGIGI